MNLNEMMKIAERGHEFIDYMNMFYSLEHDGVYAEEMRFTQEEIVEGMGQYFKNEQALKDILTYGADTVDREAVRDIILTMRGE
tara:strand:+ start:680 stop:931 length:252 start_codon:yes stop_codon:yes gene_type:complete